MKGREDDTNQDYLLSTLEKMSDLKMLKREKAVVRRLMEQEGGGHAGGGGGRQSSRGVTCWIIQVVSC
jgi:hypothetical protein